MASSSEIFTKHPNLLNVSNDNFIVVKFVNEDDKFSVGFRNWLKKNYSDEDLENLIASEEVIICMWPKADIKCAREMKTALKKLPKINGWKLNCPVQVLCFGGQC